MEDSGVGIKVCGLTSADDARHCIEAGVDWIGLNFHRNSPRYISQSTAATILAALPDRRQGVGVFVDIPSSDVLATARRLHLAVVQLHGEEPAEEIAALEGLYVIKAFRLRRQTAWSEVTAYLERCEFLGRKPDAILVDAHIPGAPGGTGVAIDREILEKIPPLPRLILAGGLSPENVGERIACVRPWMVDVATGVESSPGRKDLERVAAFVREARKAARASQSGTGMAGNETCAVAPGDQVIDNLHLDP